MRIKTAEHFIHWQISVNKITCLMISRILNRTILWKWWKKICITTTCSHEKVFVHTNLVMLMEKLSTARFDFFRTMENDDVVDVYKTIKWKSIGRIEEKNWPCLIIMQIISIMAMRNIQWYDARRCAPPQLHIPQNMDEWSEVFTCAKFDSMTSHQWVDIYFCFPVAERLKRVSSH